ncbi:MarR family winged helix-turn-helix transcriptional regulator [Vagococcus carniphilus]|uniref:MarR family transcriptional regulator n=1 Tax=Vagococcus carniphilus TaxID=218144 RepID=A0A430ATG5_9ENTE|nr:MarR family transcriptional regulator [Vagococcus carniphilus]MDT2830243.1 MarR family transcriptional regulator [Vagococcus carniphilus]MDT2834315.1 MarR family transcriptional regulator [Vagococcus carniphilus]MDT2838675.1 MarR family transcriptional regulator [Vagococcus carniphilus]MDT2853513.1 MarR family transcriptional regulator [Vagococcus carniphilus]QNN73297.1 MarR family transcriptional regulator [Vagococcus carniphilus]
MNRREMALGSFISLMRGSNKFERIVKEDVSSYNLNITEFSVLELLFHKGQQTTQGIKEKILIASSSTTYVIDQLEKKNYVTRHVSEKDKRVTFVQISEKGKILMEDIFPQHAETIENCFSNLEKEELEQLLKLLAKVNRQLDKQ